LQIIPILHVSEEVQAIPEDKAGVQTLVAESQYWLWLQSAE
jgi:hypothetical protein